MQAQQSQIKEFQRVKVTADVPEANVKAGASGVVMNLFEEFAVVELDSEYQQAVGHVAVSIGLEQPCPVEAA